MKYAALLFALIVCGAAHATAEVLDKSAAGFTVKTVVTIAAPPDRVFSALVQEIGSWWEPAHTFSGDAKNLRITPAPGGCFCETLPNGGGVQHAVVVNVVPGQLLRLTGGLGPLQEAAIAGTLSWQLEPAQGGGTTASVTYVVAGAFPGGLEKIAPAVDTVIGGQLRRLKAHVERAR